MIQDILLLTGVLLTIVMMAVFLSVVSRAPEGIEDEAGFHYRKSASPVSRPPFATGRSHLRAKKNAGLHLPAA